MPKFVTILQLAAKRPTDMKTALGLAMIDAFSIPGMIVPDPTAVSQESTLIYIDRMCEKAIHDYAKCIFSIPIKGSLDDFSFTETMSLLIITAKSLNQKYRNLCVTLGNIDDLNKIGNMNPLEWYLHNYKVATTGDVQLYASGSASTNTDITTTRHRNIGTQEKGTSGETTATLRNISEITPIDNSTNKDGDTDHVSGDAKDNTTSTSNNSTTTYNTLKEGYYNTGNKTTILKDVQDLAFNAPFFQKWLDELMQAIIIPVYASTFPVSKPGII